MKFIIAALFIIISYSINAQSDSPKKYKYFVIYVNADDAKFFRTLLDEAGLIDDFNYTKKYQVVINILSDFACDRFIVLGLFGSKNVELDPDAFRWCWCQFSKEVESGLLNWTGKNKLNLEKK